MLEWINSSNPLVTQLLHLTGGPGTYNFLTPQAKKRQEATRAKYQFVSLGTKSRADRDKIIELAKAVQYDKTSTVNNCQDWLRSLLQAMVGAGLITQSLFNTINSKYLPYPSTDDE